MYQKQVFQTSSRLRWLTFRWVGRFILFMLFLMIPVVWIAMGNENKLPLPRLVQEETSLIKTPTIPKDFNKKEKKKYKGFDNFLKARNRNNELIAAEKNKRISNSIRAAFFVDWDPQSYSSLQSHFDQLNMVMPEWFFIDPVTDTIKPQIAADAYELMKQHHIKMLPMLSNVNVGQHDGNFDPRILENVLLNPGKRQQLITNIENLLSKYGLQGINIDFEEMTEKVLDAMHIFQKELYQQLHAKGWLVTQDVLPNDDDFNLPELAKYNDYIFLMAYDQHYPESVAGSVAEQRWVEKVLDEAAGKINPSKIILAMAAYGYDWPGTGHAAENITYQQALSTAKMYHAAIDYDNDTYNCTFQYNDEKNVHHQVYFMDAGGTYNCIRFADEYGTAGVALWRLGSEDERIWKFYDRDLDNETLQKEPFDYSVLSTLDITMENPDYFGDGEVLQVVSGPEKGKINIEIDTAEQLVSEEFYKQLPTRYDIHRYGRVKNQVILTFDDGPDPAYTPRILDILEKEKVPATFFIVGINGQEYLPLLKRIYRDGFEIGNHSFTHPNMATITTQRAETEMEATRLLIEAATKHSTILFRAPYNADAEPSTAVELKPIALAQASNYYTVGESIDPDDWDLAKGTNADSIVNRVIRDYEFYKATGNEKGIILLHDAGGNREATVAALPRIIAYFKSKNIQFTTVADLIQLPRDAVMPPVHKDLVGFVTKFIYWVGRFLAAVFIVAIIIGLCKIFIMGLLATLQHIRSRKEIAALPPAPAAKVSIIVPAYNEEVNAIKTVRNLLLQDHPDFEIVFVDDGSKDGTYSKVAAAFEGEKRVRVFTKSNGGKASALNYGIEHAAGDFLVCIDADTQLMPDAVSWLMKYFYQEKIVAVAGNVKVGNEKNMLTKWQSIEYTTAQNFDRLAFDRLNCITVVPGAIGAFRKSAVLKAGGFTSDTLAEDCDITIRLIRDGGIVRNCGKAVAVTEAPETFREFMRQRFRWSYGVMQSFWKNRDACFNPQYKSLGMIALPNILLFQILMPIIAPLADLFFFISIAWSWHQPESMQKLLLYYGLFLVVDVMVSVIAFGFQKEKYYKLIWLIPQRFIYRQLMYVILFRSISRAIKGESQGWGVLKRTGNVQLSNQQLKV